jgi:hypothetical protein
MTSCEDGYEFTQVLFPVAKRNHVEELLCIDVQRINILLIIHILFLLISMI